jgi:hypothetical protein
MALVDTTNEPANSDLDGIAEDQNLFEVRIEAAELEVAADVATFFTIDFYDHPTQVRIPAQAHYKCIRQAFLHPAYGNWQHHGVCQLLGAQSDGSPSSLQCSCTLSLHTLRSACRSALCRQGRALDTIPTSSLWCP